MMKPSGRRAAAAIAVAESMCRLLLVRVRRPPPFGMRKAAVIAIAFRAACTGKRVGQCERGGRERLAAVPQEHRSPTAAAAAALKSAQL